MFLVIHIIVATLAFFSSQPIIASNFSLGNTSQSINENTSNPVENFQSENDDDLFGPIDSNVVDGEAASGGVNNPTSDNSTKGSLGLSDSSKEQPIAPSVKSSPTKVDASLPTNSVPIVNQVLPESQNAGLVKQPLPTTPTNNIVSPTEVASPEATAPTYQSPAPLTSSAGMAPVRTGVQQSTNGFSGVPTLPGTRKVLPPGSAPDRYMIEKGDTLYDICDQLIDDGNYWPKLWAINPDVKNPHFVYPGSELAFFPGDETEPPRLEIVNEDNMVPVDKGSISEAELVASNASFNYLPKSHSNLSIASQEPSEVVGPEGIVIDETVMSIFQDAGKVYTGDSVVLQIPALISKEDISPLGVVKQGFHNQGMIGPGHSLVVESEGSLSQGQVYSVLRESSVIYDSVSGDEVGTRFEFISSVIVDKPIGEGMYSARAREGRSGPMSGDILVPFRSTRRETSRLEVAGGLSTSEGTIVAMEMDNQRVTGLGGMVFVSKGQLPVGSHFSVFRKPIKSQSIFGSDDDISGLPIAAIRIIESSSDSSIGVVVYAKEEISIGDRLSN